MMPTRPCTCDRFIPGRRYIAGRDCAKCWLFAHRPAVRKAWGGDPADCDAFFGARQDMAAAELADLLAGPPLLLPDDWRSWRVMREAHLLLTERFLATMPPYPAGRFAGRGAVLCGGGAYEAGAYVACRMLRHVGWEHPIQVWHRGAAEPVSERLRCLAGVEVVDAEAHSARASRRVLGGWESKLFAVLHSPFEEVLYLDADCYPVYNPDECFEPAHNPHGIVVWPDMPLVDNAIHWPTYDLLSDGRNGLNGGHYVFTKRRAWPVLQLAGHYDNHSDYYYWYGVSAVQVGGFSDQEQLRVTLHQLQAPYAKYSERPLACTRQSYLQAGPHGRPLFVHRFGNKMALPGRFPLAPQWHPGPLPMEATAWRYFLEWLTEPTPGTEFWEEVPGGFTGAECQLWSETCRGRDVFELGCAHGRSTIAAARTAQKVVSVDRESEHHADLWLQRYGLRHKVWLRVGPVADLISTSGGPFSACLIDSGHDGTSVEADISVAIPYLRPHAILGFHNYGDPAHPDVQPAVDAAAARFGWRLVNRADCLAVFVTGASP
jgi:hypothetical protein